MKSTILRSGSLLLFVPVLLALAAPGTNACDTWVALGDVTRDGVTLFGKNSDRPNFDCQPLFLHPRRTWPEGARIDLGRLEIPQISETYATLGSSPYWCWGYEEGINEHGVAIGNEGIRTRSFVELLGLAQRGHAPEVGPTGMDLIRLGLERGKTAREALEVITDLLEEYGQFGSGIPGAKAEVGGYDNSYIIADAGEAWVLETAGRRWIARRQTGGSTSISNTTTIGTEWDLTSSDLVAHAIAAGYWKVEQKPFDFTGAYGDTSPGGAAQRKLSEPRAACSARLLHEKAGEITPRWMMRIARDRSSTPTIDRDNTASSSVAILPDPGESLPIFWWCPTTPSNSCYIPFFVHGKSLPGMVGMAGALGKTVTPPSTVAEDTFAEGSYWWTFRDLCDKIRASYGERNAIARAVFDPLEKEFEAGLSGVVERAQALRRQGALDAAAEVLDTYSRACVDRAVTAANRLRERFAGEAVTVPTEFRPFVGKYLASFGPYQDTEFTVLVQNDRLALDVPGQRVFELAAPDAEGKRRFVLTDQVAVRFRKNGTDEVTGLQLHQAGMTFFLPRARQEARAKEAPPSANLEAERKAVARVLADFHDAKVNADRDRFFSHLAPEAIILGTARDERWTLKQYELFAAPAFSSGVKRRQEITESHVFVSDRGNVAWFDERQTRPGLDELRGTGVLVKTDQGWKIVQFNLTIPVPNELAPELDAATKEFAPSSVGRPFAAPEGESADVRAVRAALDAYHRAASEADAETYFGSLAPDGVFYGSDKTERWTLEGLRSLVEPYFTTGQGWTATPIAQNVFLSEDGHTAWFDELLRNATYAETRATGVLEKVDGRWRIVHLNVSFPVPNELLDTFLPKILEKAN